MSLLDLPLEKQKAFAAKYGMSLEEWQAEECESDRLLAAHKITGYFDEETSKRFQEKMLSGTPTGN